jgi:hypothetical protein
MFHQATSSVARSAGGPLPPGFLEDEKLEEMELMIGGADGGGGGDEPRASGGGGGGVRNPPLSSGLRTAGAAALATAKGDRSFEAVHRGRYVPDAAMDEWQRHRAVRRLPAASCHRCTP